MSKDDIRNTFKKGLAFAKGAVRAVKEVKDVLQPRPRPYLYPYPPIYSWGQWAFERMEQFNRRVVMHPWNVKPIQRRPSPIFTHGHDHYR